MPLAVCSRRPVVTSAIGLVDARQYCSPACKKHLSLSFFTDAALSFSLYFALFVYFIRPGLPILASYFIL